MNKKALGAIVACIVITAAIATYAFWAREGDERSLADSMVIEGGFVVSETESMLEIRAIALDVHISIPPGAITSSASAPGAIAPGASAPGAIAPGASAPSILRISNIDVQSTKIVGSSTNPVEGMAHVDIPIGPEGLDISLSSTRSQENFTFYVIGDTQGYVHPLERLVEDSNLHHPLFVFHLGDITPSGEASHYQRFFDAVDDLSTPMFTTPGNHEAKGDMDHYHDHLAPPNYAFSHGQNTFVTISTATGCIGNETFSWLDSILQSASQGKIFLFTHIPPVDIVIEEHSLLSGEEGQRFLDMMTEYDVDAVFLGHNHIYNHTVIQGVDHYISGGGGATLYASEDRGGFYHYLEVNVGPQGLGVDIISLPPPINYGGAVIEIGAPGGNRTLSLEDLKDLPSRTGYSSFQNQFGNWRGHGNYTGVPLSILLDMVGGVEEGQTVNVEACDGYYQHMGYENVHPLQDWETIQGEFIIAYEFEGEDLSQWEDGPRLICLPPDGAYSNQDAEDTTPESMELPASAGERWVRNVSRITIG
ncbi:MAG: metallophosphoesterase [Thermoplasmata archaeon]|nr:metallophosphoesterase [Thermoplasmata archaeon]